MKKARSVSVIILLCSVLLSSSAARQDTPLRKAADVMEYGLRIADLARNEIWPDFDPHKYIFVNTAADAQGYSLGFSDAPLDPPKRTTLMTYNVRNYDVEEAILLAIHESFHVFEGDKNRAGAKWRRENSMLISAYPETDVRLSALFNLEGQLLLAALKAQDDKQLKKLLEQFLALRKLRQSAMEARFVDFDKGAESNEGLAEYAGTKAVMIGLRAAQQKQLNIPFRFANERSFMEDKYAKLNAITETGKNPRLRFYYTGSAQAFLLDRLLPDWKRRVQFESAALQDLLTEAVKFSAADSKTIAEAALREYDFANVMKRETENVAKKQAAKQAILDSVLSQKGRRYVFDFSASGRMGSTKFFDPMNITMVNEQKRVHTRMLEIGEEGKYAGKFDQAIVEDLEKRQFITITDASEQQIIADGTQLDITKPGERAFKEKLVIKTPKFSFEAMAGSISITADAVMVKVSVQ